MLTKSPGITDEKNMKMFWRENDRVATGARALIFQKNLPWVTVLNHFSPKKI